MLNKLFTATVFFWLMVPLSGLSAVRPNIVILLADDLGYGDLGIQGHPYIRTPNIDSIAREGQRWTDFYVADSLCSASRGALLTGRLPVRTGLYGVYAGVYMPDEPDGFPDREVTLAEALKKQGYRTAIYGKWHLGDAPRAYPTRHGFDEWFGVPYSNDMNWVLDDQESQWAELDDEERQAAFARLKHQRYADPKPEYFDTPLIGSRRIPGVADGIEDGNSQQSDPPLFEDFIEQPTDQTLLTRRYTERVIEFIKTNAEAKIPFFAYVPYTMPHTPLFRSDAFKDRSLAGRYGDVVEEIDWSVGEIRRTLENAGVAENTLLIFTSDNGPWRRMKQEGGLAGVLRGGKGSTFEGGVRVPAVFWWPGKISGGPVSELGSTLDIFATVMALSGGENTGIDGFDLSPTLFRHQSSPRQTMTFYRRGQLFAYRQGPWKLHFITQGSFGEPPEYSEHSKPILYNLRRDPAERFDVADENPEVVAAMIKSAEQHKSSFTKREPLFDVRWVER